MPAYLKTAYKKEPVFGYSKVVYTAQNDQFNEKLNPAFIKKALISGDIKEKDLELFKDGTNTALTLGASKYADVVVHGEEALAANIADEVKSSRYKKVVKYDEAWKEDVSSLLELYKSLTES
jgi:starch synthase